MPDKIALARPYARAVFEQAMQDNELDLWSEMLTLAANIVKEPKVAESLINPLNKREQIGELILDIVGDRFSEQGGNFIRVLAANDRLGVLPEIAKLFDERKVGSENRLNAEVTSAYPMDAAQERVFAQALEKRFGRAVNTTVHVDKNLIGGAIIQIGDVVIDDSLRMRLVRMASELGI